MLLGRDAERAVLAELVARAAQSHAGAMVLHGDPGAGKTALLDDLVHASSDARVLRTQGLESESPLAYAALHRLLRPLLPHLDLIPDPQARALGVAFGLVGGDGVDPFLVGLATLSLLTEAAEARPVLAVVDDAHWLDAASVDALLFAVRRLDADRVAVVFAVRDGMTTAFAPDGVPTLRVGRLDAASALALLRGTAAASVAHDVADRLVSECEGNPLALVELAAALTPTQLAGDAPIPAQLPLTARLERTFLDRARRLPPDAQTLLLIAAADDSGQVATVSRAAAVVGLDEGALDQAEASGLVVRDGGALRVRHPLVRSAVYQGATGRERRLVHGALATALEGTDEPDRRTWHGAAATVGPDAGLATDLEGVGLRAERRGGYAAASDAYERAAELTPGAPARSARRHAAARTAWEAGQTSRARALAAAARIETGDPVLRADVDRLRGRIEVNLGSGPAAHRIFVAAAVEVADRAPERALDLAVAAAGLAAYGGDSGAVLPVTAVAVGDSAGEGDVTHRLRRLLVAMTAASQGRWVDAVEGLRQAMDGDVSNAPPDVLAHLGQAALHIGDDAAAERCFATMLGAARDRSAAMGVLYALPRLAFPLLLAGRWSDVVSAAEEARSLSVSAGQTALSATPSALLALVAALRGEDRHDDLVAQLDAVVDQHPIGILAGPTRDVRRWATGVRAALAGETATAHHQLSQMRIPALTRMAALERIDAAVRAGALPQATAWVDELAQFASATRWPWALGVADLGRALIASPADAPRLYEAALVHLDGADRPYELARAHLAFGEQLRRSQQRVDARRHLRAALEVFEDLRAEPFVARAAHELRASGETARKRDVTSQVRLTPMERQVAQLVSQGMSNKEVAALCWVSPRTVAYHLRNCFAKTGVTSRGELARLDLS